MEEICDINDLTDLTGINETYDLNSLDPAYRNTPGINLFSPSIQGKRAELKEHLYFYERRCEHVAGVAG